MRLKEPDASQAVRRGVVIVVRRDGKFLMIRRSDAVIAPGAWCFVGGGIDDGETPEQAARREFREEVGGRIEPVARVWESWRADGKLHLRWLYARLTDGELRANPLEVAEIRWCGLDEIEQLDGLLETNQQFVAGLRRGEIRLPE